MISLQFQNRLKSNSQYGKFCYVRNLVFFLVLFIPSFSLGGEARFNRHIRPILVEHCYKCLGMMERKSLILDPMR